MTTETHTESAPSNLPPREKWEGLIHKAKTRGDLMYLIRLLLDHLYD